MSSSRRTRLILFTGLALLVVAGLVFIPPYLGGGGMSLLSPGPLSKDHSRWEGEENCSKCHVPSGGLSDSLCLDCHQPLAKRIQDEQGFHAKVEGACNDCHSEHHGLDYQQIRWPPKDRLFSAVQAGLATEKEFDHEQGAGFLLSGAHAKGQDDCTVCHVKSLIVSGDVIDQKQGKAGTSFLGLGTDCSGCHLNPHVPSQGNDCGECHGDEEWSPAPDFKHGDTRFALEGKHTEVECKECHLQGPPSAPPEAPPPPHPDFKPLVAKDAPRPFRGVGFGKAPASPVEGEVLPDCFNCHENPHRGSSEAFSSCTDCHTAHAWSQAEEAAFDHSTTGFVLDGAHARTSCADCHGKALNEPAKRECIDCHQKDDHHKGGFQREMTLSRLSCGQCHTAETWKESTYVARDHPLPLIEGHAVACEKCHGTDATYPRLPARPPAKVGPLEQDCFSCHDDVHKGKLGKDCAECHGFENFHKKATLDVPGHAELGFPIVGAHLKADCEGCHGGRNPEGGLRKLALVEVRTQGCVVCHEDEHQGQLGTTCQDCHTEERWLPSTFDEARHQASGFPLRAAHVAVPCSVCHVRDLPKDKQRFKWDEGQVARCVNCHDDPHKGQFAQDCKACHGEEAFVPSRFDAAAHEKIGFPLTGPHDTDCARCHVSGLKHGKAITYHGIPQDCAGCHEDVHAGQFANRRAGCRQCHEIGPDWTATRFDHDACRFQLKGAHRELACTTCHVTVKAKTPSGARDVVHYYPIEARECDECHVNPHAREGGGK